MDNDPPAKPTTPEGPWLGGLLIIVMMCLGVVFITYCIVANPFGHDAAGCSWTTSTEASVCP